MSIVIEQTPEQVRQAVSLVRRVDMQSARLLSSTFWCKARIEELRAPLEIAIRFKARDAQLSPTHMDVAVEFSFSGTDTGEPRARVVKISCCFEARYSLAAGYSPSTEEIEAFKAANAIFNCWPYFREYVQSAATRMGFSSPPIPFLRLQPKPAPSDKVTQTTREE